MPIYLVSDTTPTTTTSTTTTTTDNPSQLLHMMNTHYCKSLIMAIEFVTESFYSFSGYNNESDDETQQIVFHESMPNIDDINVGFFALCNENTSTLVKTFDLYECSNKDYGWIMKNIKKRVKKVKTIVVYKMPKYPTREKITHHTSEQNEVDEVDEVDDISILPNIIIVDIPNTPFQKTPPIILQKIKGYLIQVENAVGKDNKIPISFELFQYIYDNLQCLKIHQTFMNTVEKKLMEFYHDEHVKEYGEYYKKIFGKEIPPSKLKTD